MDRDQHITRRVRLALAVAARDTSDSARALVGGAARPYIPGERIRDARRLRGQALAVLDSAVLVELASGAEWCEIAVALGLNEETARRRYQDTADRWFAEHAAPGLDLSVFGTRGDRLHPDDDPSGTAEALDQWYNRHAEPWETVDPTGLRDL